VNKLVLYLLFFGLLSSVFSLNAQKKILIQISVFDSLTREPVEGAFVHFTNPKKSFSSDISGKIKPYWMGYYDENQLQIKHVNYRSFKSDLFVLKDTNIAIFLRPYFSTLKEVVVTAKKYNEIVTNHEMSTVTLTAKQIQNTPSLAGEKDLIKTLLLMPGVKSETEGSSSFNVRGGGSDQNLLLLNGVTLYSSNHLFGFLSTFNSDIIQDVKLIKGAFPAQYGGRLSSVLDVSTKEADFENLKISGSIGLIASRLTIEAPVITNKLSVLLAGRRTYIDFLFPARSSPTEPVPQFVFNDLNAKISWKINPNNKLSLFLYSDRDKISTPPLDSTNNKNYTLLWKNQIATLAWNRYINPNFSWSSQGSFSDYTMFLENKEAKSGNYMVDTFETSIRDLSLKSTLDYQKNNFEGKLGISYNYRIFNPGGYFHFDKNLKQSVNFTYPLNFIHEFSFFSQNSLQISPAFNANLGLRAGWYTGGDKTYFSPEPRVSLAYQFNEKSSIKSSFTRMQQNVHLLTNPGLGVPMDLWIPANNAIPPEIANQWSIGYFRAKKIEGSVFHFSAEAYYKTMNGVVTYKDGFSSNDLLSETYFKKGWAGISSVGSSNAYGMELFLEKKTGRFTGWCGYTLSWVKQRFADINNGEEFYPRFDKRHDLSLLVNYKINEKWSVNTSWVYSSGQAITLPNQAYRPPEFTFMKPNIPVNEMVTIFSTGKRNDFRMIPFHRLNISVQHTKMHKWGQGIFEFGLYNAYNRNNPFYYFLDTQTGTVKLKSMSIFPLLPSVSYSFLLNTH
jgi:outer membrane receptor for ferrienterochelin and colicin